MSTFEDTVIRAKELLDATGDKVSEVIDIQKTRFHIARTKAELSKDFEVLGRLWYSRMKEKNVDEDAVQAVVEEIELLTDHLREYEAELILAKGGCTCEACGTANIGDSDYCPKCGKPL